MKNYLNYLKSLLIGSAIVGSLSLTTGGYAMKLNAQNQPSNEKDEKNEQNSKENEIKLTNDKNEETPKNEKDEKKVTMTTNSSLKIESAPNLSQISQQGQFGLQNQNLLQSQNLTNSVSTRSWQYFEQKALSQWTDEDAAKLGVLMNVWRYKYFTGWGVSFCPDDEFKMIQIFPYHWKTFFEEITRKFGANPQKLEAIKELARKYMRYYRDIKGYDVLGNEKMLNEFIGTPLYGSNNEDDALNGLPKSLRYLAQVDSSKWKDEELKQIEKFMIANYVFFATNACVINHELKGMQLDPVHWKAFLDYINGWYQDAPKRAEAVRELARKYMRYYRDVKGYEVIDGENELNEFIGAPESNVPELSIYNPSFPQNLGSSQNLNANQNTLVFANNNKIENSTLGSTLNSGFTSGSKSLKNSLFVNKNKKQKLLRVQGVLGKILANNSLSFANFSNLEESDHNFLADIVDGNDTEVRKVLKEELLNVMSDQKGGIIFPQIILDVLVRDFFECFLCKLFDEKELSNLPLTLSFNAGADHNTGHSNPTEKTLFFIIEKCKGLQKIVLHVCKKAVTDKLMLELGKLGNYPNLEYLELSYSCYNLTDESHLDNLATNCKKLKYIHMNHCDSCPTAVVTDAFMAALADNCPDLEVLNINYSWQNLKEKSSITGLSQCKKLKSWHLAKHTGTITLDITLEMIAELLKGCQKLRFIELHETSIDTKDGEGEKALLELLKNMGRKGIIIRGVNINIVDGVKEIK